MDVIRDSLLRLLLFLLFLFNGLTDASVTQTAILWKAEGESATAECSHTMGSLYYQMYWYRQRPGETMRQIVFTRTNSDPDFEAEFKNERFSATKPNVENGTLTVKNLEPGDSGVYFCSVSQHSETNSCKSLTKTPTHLV